MALTSRGGNTYLAKCIILHTTVQLKHQVFISEPLENDQTWPSCLHRYKYMTAHGLNPHMHRLHANLTLCHSFVGFQGVSQHIPHCNLSLYFS